jgi:hypothetical protein
MNRQILQLWPDAVWAKQQELVFGESADPYIILEVPNIWHFLVPPGMGLSRFFKIFSKSSLLETEPCFSRLLLLLLLRFFFTFEKYR